MTVHASSSRASRLADGVERNAVLACSLFLPSAPEPQHDAAAGDVVEGGAILASHAGWR